MKKQISLLFVVVLLGSGSVAWTQASRGVLTLLEGQQGRQAIQKVITSNPAAKAFVAEVLGVKASRLTAMDAEVLQSLLIQRLEGNSADQVALQARALEFFESSVTSEQLGHTDMVTEHTGGVADRIQSQTENRIDFSEFTRTSHELEGPIQDLVQNGDLSAVEAGEAQAAILTTDIEGADVNRCFETWQKPENKALLARTYVEGANALRQGGANAALDAISSAIVRERGVSFVEARNRACALAGANPAVQCNVYGQPVLEACLN